jgi:hypothetical protein
MRGPNADNKRRDAMAMGPHYDRLRNAFRPAAVTTTRAPRVWTVRSSM